MGASLVGLADYPSFFNPSKALGFAYLDARFSYVWLNECLAKINGLPVAAHLGMPVDQAGSGLLSGIMPDLRDIAANKAEESHKEIRRQSSQGPGLLYYRITLIPRRQEDGSLLGVAMAVADITHDRSTAWALAEQFHERRMFAALAPQFPGTMRRRELVHELRNRLMPMLTVAQILKKADGLDPATLSWAAQSMEKKALELSGFASSFQDSAGLSANGPPPQKEPIDLCRLVTQALDHVSPLFGFRAEPILSTPSHGAWTLGDPAWLIHPIMLCLLKIAKQADAVALEIQAQPGHCLLIMKSQGAGVRNEGCALGQGDAGKLGMGLMLAKMLVEGEGGSLTARGMEEGDPCREIIVRLPSVDPVALSSSPRQPKVFA